MKKLSLEQMHACALEIFKDIDRFCRDNDIRYSMAFGTLLGAVRHKGFIPWDDDIDIVMPRADYDRFIRIYRSDRYRFICRENTPECYTAFGRVVDQRDTVLLGTKPWHDKNLQTGIWVDVFPLDYVPDDHDTYLSLYRCLQTVSIHALLVRAAHAYLVPGMDFKTRMRIRYAHRFHPNANREDPSQYALDFITLIRSLCSTETGHLAQVSCGDDSAGWFEKELFEQYTDLPFEDGFFRAPKEYDRVLRLLYGDRYMELPPKKDRKTGIFRTARVYWTHR